MNVALPEDNLGLLLQAAQATADLIWRHGAWTAASVILRRCTLQLPACNAQLSSVLESCLATLEMLVPEHQPQVLTSRHSLPV